MKYTIYMVGNPYWGECGCGGAIYLNVPAHECKCEKCEKPLGVAK
jgi:hypothetical protein